MMLERKMWQTWKNLNVFPEEMFMDYCCTSRLNEERMNGKM